MGIQDDAVGYFACFVACVFFGSNFVPVKRVPTGDGMFFSLVMTSAVLLDGCVVQLWRGNPKFEPLAMLVEPSPCESQQGAEGEGGEGWVDGRQRGRTLRPSSSHWLTTYRGMFERWCSCASRSFVANSALLMCFSVAQTT